MHKPKLKAEAKTMASEAVEQTKTDSRTRREREKGSERTLKLTVP